MPVVATRNFGAVEYATDAVFVFPGGLPGFEDRREFLPLFQEENAPLIFLQSLEDPGLCFVTVPARVAAPDYELDITPEDLDRLGLPRRAPRIGEEVMCLAVVSIRQEGPTANLLAPVVVNLANRRCVQAIAAGGGYSHRHPLCAEKASEEAMACS